MKNNRLSLFKAIIIQFLIISFLVRFSLMIWSFNDINFTIIPCIKILFTGLFFDIGVISFFMLIYTFYLMILPNKWIGKLFDKTFSYSFYFITTLILTFSFFAEFTFWEEFRNRFNFIAVDYLIYTYEVVQNINESYPIPLLLFLNFSLVFVFYYILKKKHIFSKTFTSTITSTQRLFLVLVLVIPSLFTWLVSNADSEWSNNRYENELSKAGIYSFFAAFKNNELSYTDFYKTQNLDLSFSLLKNRLKSVNDTLMSNEKYNIARMIKGSGIELKPNIIFIFIESLSADFLKQFGNKDNLTPTLDSLLQQSVYFKNIYATGTRTVRGMEAVTLLVPPSPGRSIIKRKNNHDLYNIGDVFKEKGYSRTFFYGGDGYFDNMNEFFGGNGFTIVDRGRGYLFGDSFTAKRINIEDKEVSFENAWGVCDEDIYNKVIKEADKSYSEKQIFFNFVMTTSNHRPYTYPDNKIDIPSGTGRKGAVKYTDYAIKRFLEKAKKKPWYKNTVFVIMADHCASSAGKWELTVSKYQIPAIIYNLPNKEHDKIDMLCSQIDLFPTLFGYLNWTYKSTFYGKDVNLFSQNDQRAFIGNYRKLGLLKSNSLMVLGDQKRFNVYKWDRKKNSLTLENYHPENSSEIISYYQTNDYLFNNHFMKSEVKY